MARPTLPSAPTAAGRGPSILSGHSPVLFDGLTEAQIAAIEAIEDGTGTRPRRSLARTFAGLVVIAVVAAGLGVGARTLWDRYEQTTQGLPGLGDGLPTGVFEQPEGNYLDTSIVVGSGADKVSTRVRQNLTSQQIDVVVDFAGDEFVDTAVKIRDGRFSLRPMGGGTAQPIADLDEATLSLVDSAALAPTWVITVDQIAPREMLPFVRNLTDVETTLSVLPIGPTATSLASPNDPAGDGDIAGRAPEGLDEVVDLGEQAGSAGTEQQLSRQVSRLPVRHYRFDVDEDAFADAEPLAYARWAQRFAQGFARDSTVAGHGRSGSTTTASSVRSHRPTTATS